MSLRSIQGHAHEYPMVNDRALPRRQLLRRALGRRVPVHRAVSPVACPARQEWGGTADAAGDREWFRLMPELLRDSTPIRLIVAHRAKTVDGKPAKASDFDPRPDVVGRVVAWDGENLRIDFTKPQP